MENNVQNVQTAINMVNNLIPMVSDAERSFKSARNWGVVDIFGGGLVTDIIKHMHLNKASSIMSEINYRLRDLQQVLGNISIPVDYRMQMGDFATFADFVFDGALADIWMESKIMTSLDQVRQLKSKLETLRSRLNMMR